MSFSDPRGQLHPALYCNEEPYTYAIEPWAHDRDDDRVLRQDWPFGDGPGSWSVPAPAYRPAQERPNTPSAGVAMEHPRSTQARRAARERRKRQERAAERYAAQVSLYARGMHPDLVITDEATDPVAEVSYSFHRLLEALGAHRRERPR